MGERWLGEAETERGMAQSCPRVDFKKSLPTVGAGPPLRPLRGHLSPAHGGGEEPQALYRSSLRNGFNNADGATALRDITAIATMVKMKGSIRNAS
ncbi:Polypeptide-transport-associated domain protein ShlB-type [Mesorhizobium loti]|nr:Polypeptide-transport-associated domain protein ShlB-type [Mesorhizobium loti]